MRQSNQREIYCASNTEESAGISKLGVMLGRPHSIKLLNALT